MCFYFMCIYTLNTSFFAEVCLIFFFVNWYASMYVCEFQIHFAHCIKLIIHAV